MADSVVKLVVDSKEYDSKIQRATQGLIQYEKKCREVGGTLEFVEKEELEFVKSLGQMETVSSNATQKLGELKKAFTELSVQYQNLTKAEKQSPYGKALAGSLDQLKGRISNLQGDLSKAQSEMTGFGDAFKQIGAKMGIPMDMFTKFGPYVAAAGAALKVATDAFRQNELIMDEWGRTTESASAVYDGFLNALNTGDFSNFFKNMGKIVSSARAAYDALDELGTFNAFNKIQVEGARTNFTEAMAAYREGSGSKQDVQAAADRLKQEMQTRQDKEQAAYIAAIEKLAASRGVDAEMLKKALSGTYGDYETLKNTPLTGVKVNYRSAGQFGGTYTTETKFAATEEEKLGEMLRKLSDDELGNIQQLGATAQATATEIAQIDKQLVRVLGAGSGNKGVKVPVEVELPEGSIAKLRKQLSEAQNAFNMAGDDEGRDAAKKRIEELTAEIEKLTGKAKEAEVQLEETFEVGSLNDLQRQLRDAQSKLAGMSPTSQGWSAALQDVQDKQKAVSDLQDKIKGKTDETVAAVEKLPDAWDGFKSGVGAVGDLVGALDSLKNIGDELASVFSGEKDAWESLITVLQSGVSIMQTVIGVMEAINTLTELSATLKKANVVATESEAAAAVTGASTQAAASGTVAAANMTTAGTAAAASSAEAGEAVAGIPIVGPILAVAAIAAVLAATFAAMSKAKSAGKFAQGGVVGGNSYSGDHLMAYVNSQELILNRAQSDSIARQLSSGPATNINITGRIRGKDILLAADNSNASRGGRRGTYANVKG